MKEKRNLTLLFIAEGHSLLKMKFEKVEQSKLFLVLKATFISRFRSDDSTFS